ncbi:MAG TPA: hypothetical protein ENK87_01310 [Nitratifractor sp.]|nr:hypothetical protein [Nitratifractor sp.]
MKVAAVAVTTLLLSGCVNENQLGPRGNSANLGQEATEQNSTVIPLDSNANVQESSRPKLPKYLKPEPFSLDSDESDPELLGPQTTLEEPLVRNRAKTQSADSNTTN